MKSKNIKLKKKFGLLSIKNPLNKNNLLKHYSLNYFSNENINFKPKYSKLELENKFYNFKIYSYFIKKFFKKKINCLEIGCGEGYGAKYLYKKVNYFGTELSDAPIKNHNKSILNKIEFFKGDFLDFNNKKKFDAIIMNGVLEHLIDLKKVNKFLNLKLKKNGLLLVSVPNDFNLFHKFFLRENLIKNEKAPWVSHEHIHYFNKQSLENLFKKNFKPISILGDFPIDIFLINNKTNYYINKSFGKEANDIRTKFYSIILGKKNLPLNKYIKFCESLSDIGLGRSLLACFKRR